MQSQKPTFVPRTETAPKDGTSNGSGQSGQSGRLGTGMRGQSLEQQDRMLTPPKSGGAPRKKPGEDTSTAPVTTETVTQKDLAGALTGDSNSVSELLEKYAVPGSGGVKDSLSLTISDFPTRTGTIAVDIEVKKLLTTHATVEMWVMGADKDQKPKRIRCLRMTIRKLDKGHIDDVGAMDIHETIPLSGSDLMTMAVAIQKFCQRRVQSYDLSDVAGQGISPDFKGQYQTDTRLAFVSIEGGTFYMRFGRVQEHGGSVAWKQAAKALSELEVATALDAIGDTIGPHSGKTLRAIHEELSKLGVSGARVGAFYKSALGKITMSDETQVQWLHDFYTLAIKQDGVDIGGTKKYVSTILGKGEFDFDLGKARVEKSEGGLGLKLVIAPEGEAPKKVESEPKSEEPKKSESEPKTDSGPKTEFSPPPLRPVKLNVPSPRVGLTQPPTTSEGEKPLWMQRLGKKTGGETTAPKNDRSQEHSDTRDLESKLSTEEQEFKPDPKLLETGSIQALKPPDLPPTWLVPDGPMEIVGTGYNRVLPCQGSVCYEILLRYKAKCEQGERFNVPTWVDPVTGEERLMGDGHHTFVASLMAGVPVKLVRVPQRGNKGPSSWADMKWEDFKPGGAARTGGHDQKDEDRPPTEVGFDEATTPSFVRTRHEGRVFPLRPPKPKGGTGTTPEVRPEPRRVEPTKVEPKPEPKKLEVKPEPEVEPPKTEVVDEPKVEVPTPSGGSVLLTGGSPSQLKAALEAQGLIEGSVQSSHSGAYKSAYRLKASPGWAAVVVNSPGDDTQLRKELGDLRLLGSQGIRVPAVEGDDTFWIANPKGGGKCAAMLMQFIPAQTETIKLGGNWFPLRLAVQQLGLEQRLKTEEDLRKVDEFLKKGGIIGDLQGKVDKDTGHFYVFDPSEVDTNKVGKEEKSGIGHVFAPTFGRGGGMRQPRQTTGPSSGPSKDDAPTNDGPKFGLPKRVQVPSKAPSLIPKQEEQVPEKDVEVPKKDVEVPKKDEPKDEPKVETPKQDEGRQPPMAPSKLSSSDVRALVEGKDVKGMGGQLTQLGSGKNMNKVAFQLNGEPWVVLVTTVSGEEDDRKLRALVDEIEQLLELRSEGVPSPLPPPSKEGESSSDHIFDVMIDGKPGKAFIERFVSGKEMDKHEGRDFGAEVGDKMKSGGGTVEQMQRLIEDAKRIRQHFDTHGRDIPDFQAIFDEESKRLFVIDPGDKASSGNYMTKHRGWVDRWVRDLELALSDMQRGFKRRVPVPRMNVRETEPKNEAPKPQAPKLQPPKREPPKVEQTVRELPPRNAPKVGTGTRSRGMDKPKEAPIQTPYDPRTETYSEDFDPKETWQRSIRKMMLLTQGSFEGSRMLDENVWSEKLDPHHRSKIDLKALHSMWEKDNGGVRDFYQWLEIHKDDEEVKQRSQKEVAYLDENQRARYRVGGFGGDGSISMGDRGTNITIKSYSGTLIFVADGASNVYVWRKELDKFHHSSFLAGAPCLTAGSMEASGGKIREVNNHSGHYRPTPVETWRMLDILVKAGVSLDTIKVALSDGKGTGLAKSAKAFYERGPGGTGAPTPVEPKTETKPEPKPEPKVEPKPEPKPEPKVEPKSEPKPEPKPEPKVESTPSSSGGPMIERGSGMDKHYYHDGVSAWGWLECSGSVRQAELAAYEALRSVGITNVPQTDGSRTPPTTLQTKGGQAVTSQNGYWIQHIPHFAFKPKMSARFGIPGKTSRSLEGVTGEKKQTLITGLEEIQAKLGDIASIVGELTIAVDSTSGKPFILDVAPVQGKPGGKDLEDTAGSGLTNILRSLK